MEKTNQNLRYSLIIPSYNEAALIESSLQTVADYLKHHDLMDRTEVIVVAAKGTDNTSELARRQASLFSHFSLIEPGPKKGKGRDVKIGILAAKGAYVVFTDADLATPIHHLGPMITKLESGKYDLVIGTRSLWKIHKGLFRKIMSVGANWLVRIMILPRARDSQCGFKGFSRSVARDLFERITIQEWAFDMELLVLAAKRRYRTGTVFIGDWADPKLDQNLVGESAIRASLVTLKELGRIWWKRLKGDYK